MSIISLKNQSNIDVQTFCSYLIKTSTSFRAFILADISLQFMENNFIEYYHKFGCFDRLLTKWKPIILVTIRGAGNWSFSQQHNLLQKTFCNENPSMPVHLSLDSCLFFVFMDTKIINLWEVYQVKGKLMVSQLWNRFHQLSNLPSTSIQKEIVFYLQAFVERRSNFHNQKFTASVKTSGGDDWASVEESKTVDGKNNLILTKGYVAYLYHDLQRLMNFSQNVIFGDSPKVINGTLSGTTVTQLNSDEADVTLTLMSASEERLHSLTFLIPTHTSL